MEIVGTAEVMENRAPIAAQCPNCGGPLSETSVLALAPVCDRCGTVITKIGGSLGLTSAYGVNDPTITRKRVEADLAVFLDYRNKYFGMLEACKEQLKWGVDQYAKMPNHPDLLELQPVLPYWGEVERGLGLAFRWGIPCCFISLAPLGLPIPFLGMFFGNSLDQAGVFITGLLITLLWYGPFVAFCLRAREKTIAANGDRPLENARRQAAYEAACVGAMKAAEPIKAAQDHRLRCQIRELEGLIETVTGKAEDLRKLLETL